MNSKTLSIFCFELGKNLYLYDTIECDVGSDKVRLYSVIRDYSKENYGFRIRLGNLAFNHITRNILTKNVRSKDSLETKENINKSKKIGLVIRRQIPDKNLLIKIKRMMYEKNASISSIVRELKSSGVRTSCYTVSKYYWKIKRGRW